ncbi:flagellar protein FlgN [Fulvimarina sp. 2208YS6-2-32]|uniref:Flagellar protein FlgN n=1 Tax=Fulvimarina uroteuthidis TaxID=3098149 RepID=A0ABU5HXP9_9HYPH|nr:flagellar protein FlgN [Fulvimarina sp. 2208YS6-2-32]MDY8107741.1 flagellar protein FlgN [Fulvimarina sp. 2208YS6-2-32]
MQTALSNAVARLEAVLTREIDALNGGYRIDLVETAGRKNQSLLELTRLTREVGPDMLDVPMRERLATLRSQLHENQSVLARHVEASHEISGIMARSLEAAESDGTYSSRPEFAGRVR